VGVGGGLAFYAAKKMDLLNRGGECAFLLLTILGGGVSFLEGPRRTFSRIREGGFLGGKRGGGRDQQNCTKRVGLVCRWGDPSFKFAAEEGFLLTLWLIMKKEKEGSGRWRRSRYWTS